HTPISSTLFPYTTLFRSLIALILGGGVATFMVFASTLFGPKKHTAMKDEPFECGNPSSGTAWGRFSVKFYLVAILFIVFDVEVVDRKSTRLNSSYVAISY